MKARRLNLLGSSSKRRGNVLVLSAVLMIPIFGFLAFTVDTGYICYTKGQLENAADASALAASMEFGTGSTQLEMEMNVRQAAYDVAAANFAAGKPVLLDLQNDIELGKREWNAQTNQFDLFFGPTATPFNVVRVTARMTQSGDSALPLFFAPAIGHDTADITAQAMATFQPRDLVLALDFSGSMNNDSEFRSIGSIPQASIEANILQIYQDLGSPIYGTLPFQPEYLTRSGQAASGSIPHIDVTWKGKQVSIVSTMNIENVVIEFSNSSTQTYTGFSGNTATVPSSPGYNKVRTVWVKSGDNESGAGPNYGEEFDFSHDGIKEAYGLDAIPYPYPDGAWWRYINYVGRSNDVEDAGYEYMFGIMSLINYWNDEKPGYSQTPDLWKTSQQPVKALKDAVGILSDIMSISGDDQLGLSIYTDPNNNGALLESGLTDDYGSIKSTTSQRQAGHYDRATNIGAGIREARLELEANGRSNAQHYIVLMTDGIANESSTSASPFDYALNEADAAAASGIRIISISLGAQGDDYLMEEIADRTSGEFFDVPGGQTVEQYSQQLEDIFKGIANQKALKLIPPQ